MKNLLFLFLPFFLYAQSVEYPDTVFLKTGLEYPCMVSRLNKHRVEFRYGDNQITEIGLAGIHKLIISEFGVVYRDNEGFTVEPDTVQQYIRQRSGSDKKVVPSPVRKVQPRLLHKPLMKSPGQHRWSFGIFYIPFFSGKQFRLHNTPYDPSYIDIIPVSTNITMMEGQFSYRAFSRLRITLDIGYTLSNTSDKVERHRRFDPPGNNEDTGTFTKSDLKIFDFNIGLKFYLRKLLSHRISPYFFGGFGKKITSATDTFAILFQEEPPDVSIDDNRSEFLDKLNSPFHANVGFGVEYPFNHSLTLFSAIRLVYSKISATYDYRAVGDTFDESRRREFKTSDVVTHFGLGIQFYF